MGSVVNRIDGRKELNTHSGDSHIEKISIVICPPEFVELRQAMNGEPADATHIIQGYLTRCLQERGHNLNIYWTALMIRK